LTLVTVDVRWTPAEDTKNIKSPNSGIENFQEVSLVKAPERLGLGLGGALRGPEGLAEL